MVADFLDSRVLWICAYQVQSLEELPFGSRGYHRGAIRDCLAIRNDTLPYFQRRVKQDC